ncbi:P-loop containing nucleoside triphosphate hydrolase protein [Piptocephalis cylindrospora]|uniref:P-loop containing nucleoside triphosphate hydrolase protein n=1 Tax=Piptocephalis cylindrospora TaxID=1907219 RepID=A0A4P9Y8U9_9FUNG|nr:P-loop containing nucleoside triphosphate hydrolase protein [Piptocephalis cylindrospora]|eukprot:RKP15244.1 P-loop containing nucleoside triphosphate hydrolase protein [Piptocephalis cylindrospora]
MWNVQSLVLSTFLFALLSFVSYSSSPNPSPLFTWPFLSSGGPSPTYRLHTKTFLLVVSQVLFYKGLKYLMAKMNPDIAKRQENQKRSKEILGRIGVKDLKLDQYEDVIAAEVVHPDEIDVDFNDVGGLDSIIQDLQESIILPLTHPELFTSATGLLGTPKGILLYGAPGCGKTMISKALAKESGATFINLRLSTLTNKWFGESNKLIMALFGLARKLQPSIIFIDEIDSFLRERRSTDHEAMGMMKAEFMTLWDGLVSGKDSRIIILGATNRPSDIDQAILRRMPKRFQISPPSPEQRESILRIILRDASLHPDLTISRLVSITEGFSGSDLKEMCRHAVMIPRREYIHSIETTVGESGRGYGWGYRTYE